MSLVVQRGTVELSGTSTDITISAVDLAHAFVLVDVVNSSTTSGARQSLVHGSLTNTTTLRLERDRSTGTRTVHWQVVEAPQWSVQAVDFASTGASVSESITSVTLGETFVVVSGRSDSANDLNRQEVRASLASATSLTLTRDDPAGTMTGTAYVVSVPGAAVQRGTTTIAASSVSAVVSLSSVNLTRSFVVLSQYCDATATETIGGQRCRARLTSATELALNRRTSSVGTVTASWFVVQLPESGVVRSASGSINPSATVDVTITAVATAATFTTITATGDFGQDRTYPATLTSSTNVRLVNPAGFPSPYSFFAVEVDNVAPNAPTLNSPTGGATINRTVGQVFSWTFSDPDPGDSQSEYQIRARVASTSPWTVEVGAAVPTQSHTFAGGTFTAGNWEWQARTRDQAGVWGPWSASETFTATDPPAGPTITAPANDATIGQLEQLVGWSVAAQEAYELRRVADDAGSPDESDVLFTTGTVNASGARSRVLEFPVNNTTEHIQLRVRVAGLWSEWSSIRVAVSYTPPETPEVELFADAGSGTITVQPTFPPPGVGVPAVESWDVLVRVSPGGRADLERPVGGAGIRIAAMLSASKLSFADRAPASGFDYQYRIVARGDNGTTSVSDWTASAVAAPGFYGGAFE